MNYLEFKGSKLLMFHRKMLFKFTRINNGIIICWSYSTGDTVLAYDIRSYSTGDTVLAYDITFPITFKDIPSVLGVGYFYFGRFRSRLNTITITGFSWDYAIDRCGSNSYLAIGN